MTTIKKSISIPEYQAEFLERANINLSKLVQKAIDREMLNFKDVGKENARINTKSIKAY